MHNVSMQGAPLSFNRELFVLYLRSFTDGRPNPEFVQQAIAQLPRGQIPS